MRGAEFEGGPIWTDMPRGEQLRSGQRALPPDGQRRLPADEPPAGTPAAAALQPQRPSPPGSAGLPAEQPLPAQQQQQAQEEGAALYPLFVLNVGDAMPQEELLAYFR